MLNRLSSVVGVDGGGTKTEAVIIDADQRVIGEGRAGPSNPLRVGIAAAAARRSTMPARRRSCVAAI
jgi:N-acetylglucosamine kinase-like BadF-type ATPase